jgi:RNA polymerase sigma-B factor
MGWRAMVVQVYKPKFRRKEKEQKQLNSDDQTKGTTELQEQLVLRFTPLVESLAKKYACRQISYEDLVQVGMIGLLAALHRFDKQYGRTFESFAIPTIVGEMKRYIRDRRGASTFPAGSRS